MRINRPLFVSLTCARTSSDNISTVIIQIYLAKPREPLHRSLITTYGNIQSLRRLWGQDPIQLDRRDKKGQKAVAKISRELNKPAPDIEYIKEKVDNSSKKQSVRSFGVFDI